MASNFSELQEECLANFDSCYYNSNENLFSCTCLGGYIATVKHLDVKVGECQKLNFAELVELESKSQRMRSDFWLLLSEVEGAGCSPSKGLKTSWQNLVMPEKKRQTLTSEICTCQTDGCNENKKPSEPDDPETTTEENSIPGIVFQYRKLLFVHHNNNISPFIFQSECNFTNG